MDAANARVLMISPFTTVQRGNSLTTDRLQRFLPARGFQVDRISLENQDWPELIARAIAYGNYSLVHGFHAWHFGRALEAVPEIRCLPMILTTTGTDIHYDLQGPHQATVLEAMRSVQKIVVFNEDFRQSLLLQYPDLADKITTIPQGIFLEPGPAKSRSQAGLGSDNFVFLLPSGWRPVKNNELAINALQELHRDYPQLRLLIIGPVIDADYAKPWLDRIASMEWIINLGEVPHQEISSWLALGDVVLNTSRSEGQPQAALEAMSLGKPCILSAVSGNLHLIEPGKEGFYVRNQVDLVAAARYLISHPGRCAEMGQNARCLVESKFPLKNELDAYSRLYQETLLLEHKGQEIRGQINSSDKNESG